MLSDRNRTFLVCRWWSVTSKWSSATCCTRRVSRPALPSGNDVREVVTNGMFRPNRHISLPQPGSCTRRVSCHVVSCRVVSCRVVSCRVVSCRVVSCRVVSCRVVSCRVVSCRVGYSRKQAASSDMISRQQAVSLWSLCGSLFCRIFQ